MPGLNFQDTPENLGGLDLVAGSLTTVTELIEDGANFTVYEKRVYTKKSIAAAPVEDVEPIGCFRCFRNKKDGAFVCVPIQCPVQK